MVSPLRSDARLAVARVVSDLEVDDEVKKNFKVMRYPVIKGDAKVRLFKQRVAWYQQEFNFSLQKADNWTSAEFKAVLSSEDEWTDQNDPGQIFEWLENSGLSQSRITQLKDDTKRFFATVDNGLIRKTPMKTYPKLRYSTTTNLQLFKQNEVPEKLDFWTQNAGKLINIVTQDWFKVIFFRILERVLYNVTFAIKHYFNLYNSSHSKEAFQLRMNREKTLLKRPRLFFRHPTLVKRPNQPLILTVTPSGTGLPNK